MKRTLCIVFASILFLASVPLLSMAQDEPLGDAARKTRREKPAPSPAEKVYDNDSLPKSGGLGYISGSGVAPSSESKSENKDKEAESKKPAASSEASAEDRKKVADEWASKISDQKAEISRLERELTVLQRENQIRATVFYADAGARLRDEKKYAEDDRRYRDETAAKQKALDEARQKLADMQDEARKAGVPASTRE